MTEKQKAYVREFLIDGNATQAAIRAGYSAKTARSQAHDLRRHSEVAAAIEEAMAERMQEAAMGRQDIISALAGIAKGHPLPTGQLPRPQDQLLALQALARYTARLDALDAEAQGPPVTISFYDDYGPEEMPDDVLIAMAIDRGLVPRINTEYAARDVAARSS